jgi:hypothetical protein
MSNVLALAVVDAAQAHDDMVNAQVETLAPRDEVAVANALDDLGFNTWRAGVAASTAEESYSTALEVGATLAEAEIAFVEGWAARSAPVPANKKLAEQWAIAKAWAQACLDKADARAKKPNRHGQRDAAEQKAYDAAQSAKRYAKGNLGLKAKRAPRAAKADGVSTASEAEKDMGLKVDFANVSVKTCATAQEAEDFAMALATYIGKAHNAGRKAFDNASLSTLLTDFVNDVRAVVELNRAERV